MKRFYVQWRETFINISASCRKANADGLQRNAEPRMMHETWAVEGYDVVRHRRLRAVTYGSAAQRGIADETTVMCTARFLRTQAQTSRIDDCHTAMDENYGKQQSVTI